MRSGSRLAAMLLLAGLLASLRGTAANVDAVADGTPAGPLLCNGSPLPPKCAVADETADCACVGCLDGYVLNLEGDCTCPPGYYVDRASICQPCDGSDGRCTAFTDSGSCECQTCASGYQLVDGTCISCPYPKRGCTEFTLNSCFCESCAQGWSSVFTPGDCLSRLPTLPCAYIDCEFTHDEPGQILQMVRWRGDFTFTVMPGETSSPTFTFKTKSNVTFYQIACDITPELASCVDVYPIGPIPTQFSTGIMHAPDGTSSSRHLIMLAWPDTFFWSAFDETEIFIIAERAPDGNIPPFSAKIRTMEYDEAVAIWAQATP